MIACPTCGGELIPLGQLGDLLHYRCRACGADSSTKVDECQCDDQFITLWECPCSECAGLRREADDEEVQ